MNLKNVKWSTRKEQVANRRQIGPFWDLDARKEAGKKGESAASFLKGRSAISLAPCRCARGRRHARVEGEKFEQSTQ